MWGNIWSFAEVDYFSFLSLVGSFFKKKKKLERSAVDTRCITSQQLSVKAFTAFVVKLTDEKLNLSRTPRRHHSCVKTGSHCRIGRRYCLEKELKILIFISTDGCASLRVNQRWVSGRQKCSHESVGPTNWVEHVVRGGSWPENTTTWELLNELPTGLGVFTLLSNLLYAIPKNTNKREKGRKKSKALVQSERVSTELPYSPTIEEETRNN